jgi:NAD+ kinase
MSPRPRPSGRITRILFVGKRGSPPALAAVRRLAKGVASLGVEVTYDAATARALGRRLSRPENGDPQLCVVVGGDGTLLSAARGLAGRPIPILGVNLGGLGFMAEMGPRQAPDRLRRLVKGTFDVGRRMTLEASLERGRNAGVRQAALNDVVITKSALARMIEVQLAIDGRMVTVYRADGLIVATPTGSTAYSLSAGGPIIHPEIDALLIAPICPHTLSMRPLVVPATARIEVTLLGGGSEVYLTLDGQVGHPLRAGDRVRVRRGSHDVLMVRSGRRDYFELLRRKLRWGER